MRRLLVAGAMLVTGSLDVLPATAFEIHRRQRVVRHHLPSRGVEDSREKMNGRSAEATFAQRIVLNVKFSVGEFETELKASAQGGTLGSGGAWGKAAKKIAKQVDEWASANRAKLAK